MKPRSIFIVTGFLILIPGRALSAESINVDVVVDLTAEGKKEARPTAAKPAYYLPLPAGYKERGSVEVFFQHPPPNPSVVTSLVTEALAGQGYLVATKQSPPSLVLVYWWGYISPQGMIVSGKKFSKNVHFVNQAEMLSMVGGDTIDTTDPIDPRMQEVVAASRHPRDYLLVSAFDFKEWLHHRTVLLWRAHVSTRLWGQYLDEVLPTLIATGAPLFGVQTPRPVFTNVPLIGNVIVGTPQVKDFPSNPSQRP